MPIGKISPQKKPDNERKLKEVEVNMNMIQLKMFLDHSGTVLNQAKALGILLYIVLLHLTPLPVY